MLLPHRHTFPHVQLRSIANAITVRGNSPTREFITPTLLWNLYSRWAITRSGGKKEDEKYVQERKSKKYYAGNVTEVLKAGLESLSLMMNQAIKTNGGGDL
jgi:hypothetical protein